MELWKKVKQNRDLCDVIVLFILAAVGLFYAYATHNLFIGRSVFSGAVGVLIPVIYLGLRRKKPWKKIIFGTIVFGVLYAFMLSFYAEATKAWNTNDYIFGVRFFGLNTVEELFGQGLMALYIFTFYEHFFGSGRKFRIGKKSVLGILVGFLGAIFLIGVYKLRPEILTDLGYSYLIVGLIAIIPTIFFVILKPSALGELLKISGFFFLVWMSAQYFAVLYNYWGYAGEYFGWIRFYDVEYPFEELFFWMLLYAPTIVVYYRLTSEATHLRSSGKT